MYVLCPTGKVNLGGSSFSSLSVILMMAMLLCGGTPLSSTTAVSWVGEGGRGGGEVGGRDEYREREMSYVGSNDKVRPTYHIVGLCLMVEGVQY